MQILNKSTRKYLIDGKFVAPNEIIDVKDELGKKLELQYPGELMVIAIKEEKEETIETEEKPVAKPKAKKKA